MAKKQRKKLPSLEEIKKKIKGKVYVGDGVKELIDKRDSLTKERDSLTKERDSLTKERDSLTKERDSLKKKSELQQKEIDSLKQVIKIRVK